LQIFSYSAEALKLLKDKGFLVIIITNQSGIGRGYFDQKTLSEIHEKLIAELAKENAKLDAIYFCPHISEDECDCRKPKTGMIEQAVNDFHIDLENSWMIGDKAVDVETGINAGTKTALVLTGYGQNEIEKIKDKVNLIGKNLSEIVEKI
jgi:D-glycero-D-manno-heptose 1,7-bisphosphate phosphatase